MPEFFKSGFKRPAASARMTVKDIILKDEEDESLVRFKETLLGNIDEANNVDGQRKSSIFDKWKLL